MCVCLVYMLGVYNYYRFYHDVGVTWDKDW